MPSERPLRQSGPGNGRTRPALDAGFFISRSIVRNIGSKSMLRSAGSGDVPVSNRRAEQRSLTTEGSRHALRGCQGSRNATTANLLENSAMWKGELASTRASVFPRQKWRANSRRKPCGSEEGLQDPSFVFRRVPIKWDVLGKFYGQATKSVRWMPWRQQAMKDVASCDKPRGAASRL